MTDLPSADLAAREAEATTLDAFYGGRLKLRQPAKGHRAGTDAVLLAASVPRDFSGLVCDVGAGVGAAGLGAALACPNARVRLVENDPKSLALAAENIDANDLAARAAIDAVDILSAARRREAGLEGLADMVITNPPFHDASAVRLSPDAGRRAAHVLGEGGLEAWITGCLALLAPRGSLVVVHRAEVVPALLRILDGRGALTLLPVLPRAGLEARRVLVRAQRGSRAPFRLAAPLVLHEGEGFTEEVKRLHRGDAAIEW